MIKPAKSNHVIRLSYFYSCAIAGAVKFGQKSDLLDIAAHFELTTINNFMLKYKIKNIPVQFLVDKEILDSSAFSLVLVRQTGLQMRGLEIQKQIELEKNKIRARKTNYNMKDKCRKKN